MDGEDIPDFSSLKEETAYWKELSLKYKQSFQEARDELVEFQEGSRVRSRVGGTVSTG